MQPSVGVYHDTFLLQVQLAALEQTPTCQLQADWQDPCDTGEVDLPPATRKVPSTLTAASQHECHHEHGAVSMQYILQAACESLPVIDRHGKILIGTNYVTITDCMTLMHSVADFDIVWSFKMPI